MRLFNRVLGVAHNIVEALGENAFELLVDHRLFPEVALAILADKKVFVIPTSSQRGRVTAFYIRSGVEDRQGYFWKEAVVNEQLESILAESSTMLCATPRHTV